MAKLPHTRLLHRVASPISLSRNPFPHHPWPRATATSLDVRPNAHSLILQAHLHCSHSAKKDLPQIPSESPTHPPISLGNESGPPHQPHTILLILQRTALAYLLSISLCLAWTGINGWYLVLNGQADKVDERSPLRIVWDATRWPVDAASGLFESVD